MDRPLSLIHLSSCIFLNIRIVWYSSLAYFPMNYPDPAQSLALQDRGWSGLTPAQRTLGSSSGVLDIKNKDLSGKASSGWSSLTDARPPKIANGRMRAKYLPSWRSTNHGQKVKLSQLIGTPLKRLSGKTDSPIITKAFSASGNYHHSDRAPYPLDDGTSSAPSLEISPDLFLKLSSKRNDGQASESLRKSVRKSNKSSSSSKRPLYAPISSLHPSLRPANASSSLSSPPSSSASPPSGSPSEPSVLSSTRPSSPGFPVSLLAQIYHDIHIASALVMDEARNKPTEFLEQKANTSGGLHTALMLDLLNTYQVIGQSSSLHTRVSSLIFLQSMLVFGLRSRGILLSRRLTIYWVCPVPVSTIFTVTGPLPHRSTANANGTETLLASMG